MAKASTPNRPVARPSRVVRVGEACGPGRRRFAAAGPGMAVGVGKRHVARTINRIIGRNLTDAGSTKNAQRRITPVTLLEVCCSTRSSFAKSVLLHGGAAIRVTWPPNKMRILKPLGALRLRPASDEVDSAAVS